MIHDDTNAKSEGLTLSPKLSFLFGLIGGILVLCSIGFFILLAVVLKGGLPSKGSEAQPVAAVNPSPSPSPSPSAPQPEEQVGTVTPVSATDNVQGPKSAPVTLIEYSDFQCPYCQAFQATMNQAMAKYKGQIRWVYRYFPLSFHPNATPAANAAACAAEQGKFWEFADALYADQSNLGDALYTKVATDLKLNMSKFNSCYTSKKYQSAIDADRASGSAANVSGTPGTIIIGKNGSKQLVPGALPIEQLSTMIDAALQN